jgi:hypothetical protein
MTYFQAQRRHGTVFQGDTAIAIMQPPFPSAKIGKAEYFEALGEDQQGNQFEIMWPMTQAVLLGEPVNDGDECDWDTYEVRAL